MKPRKQTILIMLLGLLLIAFAAAMAQDPQTPAQGDQKKKADACCAMESCCCCSGDSCQTMSADGATTTAATDTADKKDAKHSCCSDDSCKMKAKDMNHADDHDCCSCCGDSCETNMNQDGATMKHDANMKHDMKGHKGDCCKMKQKSKTKKAA